MITSSRTPEGEPRRCPVCGTETRIDPSESPGDAPCPACGHSLWFREISLSEADSQAIVVRFANDKMDESQRIEQIDRELNDTLARVVHNKLLLNFDGVSFMSSDMISKLIMLNKSCKSRGVKLKFCGVAPSVMEVFKITQLDRIFDMVDTGEMAFVEAPRLTAQLVTTEKDAVLAYSCVRSRRGPNGETHCAALLRTSDAGSSWNKVPLRRGLVDRLVHWGYPIWPPESIASLSIEHGCLTITFRDEWVPYEPGGESLWRGSQRSGGTWKTSRVRYMDYEHRDSPSRLPEVPLLLPDSFMKPSDSMISSIQESS